MSYIDDICEGMVVQLVVDRPCGNEDLHVGDIGVVRCIDNNEIAVEWEIKSGYNHSCGGHCMDLHGFWVARSYISPINAADYGDTEFQNDFLELLGGVGQ